MRRLSPFFSATTSYAAAWQSPKALCFAKSAGVLACETLGGGNFPQRKGLRCAAWERRRLACETLGDGNILVRNKIPTHAQPTQARRLLSRHSPRGRLWQKLPTPAQPSQARRLLSGHSLRGRLWQKLPPPAQPSQATVISSCAIKYPRLHNHRRRDACYPGIRRGGDFGKNYQRLHNPGGVKHSITRSAGSALSA